ncbi:MAG TPA: ribosomal protein S18-alanine N-acetyltransferase [Ornithinibacter sp.]|nr:ribosomal protein S18-alanine N-acetyltransferase [Ornithinibacter sp.]HPV90114.1 ribosomal protein S18-alanine N-acetyltransferase [Ornithinibacter sp.]
MSTLRDVHWTDIEQLAQLERELFADDAWSQQTWWAELAGRPRRDYVAEVEGAEVLGYAGLDHGGDVADVMTIAVAPSARGRGLGRRLLDELETRARAGRAASVMLEVRADNAAAIGLYDRAGYTVVSTRRRYYQPGDIDALVMRRILSDGEVGGE